MLDMLEMFQKKWRNEGIELGREQGIERGIERNKKETVGILLRNGRMTTEEISQDFNIPLEEVLEIAGKMMT